MKNEKPKSRERGMLGQIVIVGLTAFAGAYAASYFQAKSEIAMRKYDLMTDFHCRTAELFSEAELLGNPLIQKYGLDRVNRGDVPPEEWTQFNKVIQELNGQLLKIYVTMPDDSYGPIRDAIVPGVGSIGQVRNRVLVELRKTRFENTQYTDPCDIRYFNFKGESGGSP